MSHHEVGASKVSETGCTDAAAVRPVRAIRDEVNTHLALGRLDSTVCLPRRDGVALAEELGQMLMRGNSIVLRRIP